MGFFQWLLGPSLTALLERIIVNQEQLAQVLADLRAQLTKASNEITSRVAALEAALANAGQVTPQVEAELAGLRSIAQALDDLNPDAPPAPPPPEG